MALDHSILAFTLAATLVAISPGPDTFLVITTASHGGIRRGLAAIAGIATGGIFYVAVFALGVAQVLVYSPKVFWTVKIAGAAYLLWLGIVGLRSALRRGGAAAPTGDEPLTGASVGPVSVAHAWARGLVTNMLNPKVAVFYLAFLPQFMAPGDSIPLKSALLIGIHYTIGALWLSVVALAVSRMSGVLQRDAVRRALDGGVGLVMASFGVRLALLSR